MLLSRENFGPDKKEDGFSFKEIKPRLYKTANDKNLFA